MIDGYIVKYISNPVKIPTTVSVKQNVNQPKRNAIQPKKKRGKQLFKFIYDLLCEKGNENIIRWTNDSGGFKFIDPEAVSMRWANSNGLKSSMSYDNLSRSLRWYYQKGVMKKTAKRKHEYSFTNGMQKKKNT